MSQTPNPSTSAIKGVLLVSAAVFLFAAGDTAGKVLFAPVNYLHIVWATLLGWAVFAHMPDALTIAGMGCVLAAGALVARRSARKPADQIESSAQIGT